ncbi:MAG: hypothetical protein OHK0024_28770 [Thalassobaculales bacterium]
MAASPCIGVCRLDPAGRQCLGCHRRIEEIARWPDLTEDERRAILLQLPARRATADSLSLGAEMT